MGAQSRPQDVELQAAIRAATLGGDLSAAIQQFKALVAKYPADRVVAAKALVELADCYRRLGDAEAQRVYQRILTEYRDQPEAVAVARARLAPSESEADPNRRVWTVPIDGNVAGPVSYDGRHVAYVDWSDAGKGDLFVHAFGAGADRRVTQSGNVKDTTWKRFAEQAAFSRDGVKLAYSWVDLDKNREELRIVGLAGTAALQSSMLVGLDTPSWIDPYDWSRDGQWIAAMWKMKDGPREIGLVSTKDGSLHSLKTIDRPCACDLNLSLSPDGKYLAFDLPGVDTRARDIFVLDTAPAAADRREVPAVVYRGHDALVGWAPDGQSLIFTSDRSQPGTSGLWTMPFAGGRPGTAKLLRSELGPFVARGVTATGAIYFCRCEPQSGSDIKMASFDFETGQFLSPPADAVQQFVGTNSQPFWSPDGKSFVYRSLRPNQDPILAIQDVASGDVRELRPKLASLIDPRWAPDGRSIAVMGRDFQARFGFYRIDVATGSASPMMIIDRGQLSALGPEMWPGDGRKFYYRHRIGDTIGFVELDVASGAVKTLYSETRPGTLPATVSPDGRTAYYRRWVSGEGSTEQFAIVARDLAQGTDREILRGPNLNLGHQSLSPDGRYLSTITGGPPDSPVVVSVVPVAGGDAREVMRAQGEEALNAGVWAPDGRSLFVRTPVSDTAASDFWWVPLDGRATRQLTEFAGLKTQGLRLHPDGHRILVGAAPVTTEAPKPTEFWVLENVIKK
jgi:Tol biopolymer transport system component